VAAHPLANAFDVLGDDILRRPHRRAAADIAHEARENLEAPLRMSDFGMELEPIDPTLAVRDPGERRVTRSRDDLEPRRQTLDAIAVAHPHLQRLVRPDESGQKRIVPA